MSGLSSAACAEGSRPEMNGTVLASAEDLRNARRVRTGMDGCIGGRMIQFAARRNDGRGRTCAMRGGPHACASMDGGTPWLVSLLEIEGRLDAEMSNCPEQNLHATKNGWFGESENRRPRCSTLNRSRERSSAEAKTTHEEPMKDEENSGENPNEDEALLREVPILADVWPT